MDASGGPRAHPLPFTDQAPDRHELEAWQLVQLNGMLDRVRAGSPFYRELLPEGHLGSLDDLARLPFTNPRDLAGTGLLAVPAQRVERIVSMPTSGTAGPGKRVAFSAADLENTRASFAAGLHCIARPGETTAVLFPCTTPNGLGSLICDALGRIGARALPLGPIASLPQAAQALAEAGATSAVGGAHALHALARWCVRAGERLPIERVLLSSDNACDAMTMALRDAWDCEVHEHYGMTETGFGCAVDCRAHDGMHIRELDLLVEIVDPQSGDRLPDGVEGEVVITTLAREAMPLVRYRTGDVARIIPGACPCGGTLRRLGRVRGHVLGEDGRVLLDRDLDLALDEALFSLPQVIDFEAHLQPEGLDAATAPPTAALDLALISLGRVDATDVEQALLSNGIECPARFAVTVVDDLPHPLTGKAPRLKMSHLSGQSI